MTSLRFAVVTLAAFAAACATTQSGNAQQSPSDRAVALRDSMRLSKETTALLDSADASIKAGEMDKAKGALASAKTNLADPHMALSTKHQDLEKREADLEAKLTAPAPEPVAAAPEAAPAKPVVDAPKALDDAMADMTKARAGLHGHELAKADVETAEKARDTLSQALDDGKDFAQKNDDYAAKAKEGAQLLTDASDDIRLATLIADFVTGPGADKKKGLELSKKAMTEHDASKRRADFKEARAAFEGCEQASLKMMSESPVLNRTALFLSTERTSPKKIASACAQQKKLVAKKIASR